MVRFAARVAGWVSVFMIAVPWINPDGRAQTLPIDCLSFQMEWDYHFDTGWKVANPSGPSDFVSVDINATRNGQQILGICGAFFEAQPGGQIGELLIAPDNLALDPSGATPDPSRAVTRVVHPIGLPGIFCEDLIAFDVPDVTLDSSGHHVVMKMEPGDSSVWVGADTDYSYRHSWYSADGFATKGKLFSGNFLLGTVTGPVTPGTLWARGSSTIDLNETEELCFIFLGERTLQPFMLFVTNCKKQLKAPAAPFVWFTGTNPIDDAGHSQLFELVWPCDFFTGGFCLAAVYLALNGQINVSNHLSVNVSTHPSCYPQCWGQRDDGLQDGSIWKVQNPSGSGDWFNVHHGSPPSFVHTLTSVEIGTWNFCGQSASFAEVGLYDNDSALDPCGFTPMLPALAADTLTQVPGGQMQWGYPATVYDCPDLIASPSIDYHASVRHLPLGFLG